MPKSKGLLGRALQAGQRELTTVVTWGMHWRVEVCYLRTQALGEEIGCYSPAAAIELGAAAKDTATAGSEVFDSLTLILVSGVPLLPPSVRP